MSQIIVPLCIDTTAHAVTLKPMLADHDVAALKARTLLAFLWENKRLETLEFKDDCMILYPANVTDATTMFQSLEDGDKMYPESNALLLAQWNKPSWHQPGIILLRAGLDITVFERFIESSKAWMDKHPTERGFIRSNCPLMFDNVNTQTA